MPLVEIALAIGQSGAKSLTASILQDLLKVQNEQVRILKELRQDVKTLVDGPWHRANLLLAEAANTSRSSTSRGYLADARDALFDAYSHYPSASPRRATVAVNMSVVFGLLGDNAASLRWGLKAHEDQHEATEAEIPMVVKGLNSRAAAFKSVVDGDFWELVERSRKEDPSGTQRWLREVYELGLDPFVVTDPIATGEGDGANVLQGLTGNRGVIASMLHEMHWLHQAAESNYDASYRPFLDYIAIAGTTTAAGRGLLRLHQMGRDLDTYRNVCIALSPSAKLPRYELDVDLSKPRGATIVLAGK
jgi:hypothetical protein